MKTNGMQKALAILLSVLLAMPLFVLPTFADGEVFNRVYTSSSSYESGQSWYDANALAAKLENTVYRNADYYLSEDGNTLKIVYTADSESVTELHTRADEPLYFNYFRVVPEFGEALPTSPDGLEDGDYWYDQASLVSLARSNGLDEQYMYLYEDATFYLSVDGTMLRKNVTIPNTTVVMHDDEMLEDGGFLTKYLYQVGVDPNEGFTLLPTSDEGLEDGDYWFDRAGFLATLGEKDRQTFENAEFYLSDDGTILRISLGITLDLTEEDGAEFFYYLRQVGVDPNEGYILLPKSEEGLSDGDYWYDAAGIAAAAKVDAYLDYSYYLKEDGTALRIVMDNGVFNVPADSDYASTFFGFLRQVGVDPYLIEGYTPLPTSDEGLEDGDYWFDLESLLAMMEEDSRPYYQTAKFYLSDDANTIRMVLLGTAYTVSRDDSSAYLYFDLLHQVGVDPNAGFIPLPKTDESLADGVLWFDAAGFASYAGGDTPSIYLNAQYYLSDDGATLRIILENGGRIDIAKNDSGSETYFTYVRTAGEVFTVLPTSEEGLEDGEYWYDAAGLAAMMENDECLSATYAISGDGETMRVVISGQTRYCTEDGNYFYYFGFIRQVGVDPNANFTPLPTSAEGLSDGDYWYDAAGLAAAEEEESLLTAEYYLSLDGTVLRIMLAGLPYDFEIADVNSADIVQFLHQVGEEPEPVFTLLPTNADGLADGEYWYDAAGLAFAEEEDTLVTAQFYLSEDANTLRVLYEGETITFPRQDDTVSVFYFLRQAGTDPNEGFSRLPIAADDLSVGDYWYDAAGLAADTKLTSYLRSEYYLSDDCKTLRIVRHGEVNDYTADDKVDGIYYWSYLHQIEDPNAGFALLPTSDEGLQDGAYWYDAEGLRWFTGSEDYLSMQYYLSTDGNTLRLILNDTVQDIARGTLQADRFYPFLRTVGYDPNVEAGFTLLPTSDEGLQDGDYWYDRDGLAAFIGRENYLHIQYYLSADGQTLRLVLGTASDTMRGTNEGTIFFSFLRQVGVDPFAGFVLLPKSADGLAAGDYWFDAAGFAVESEEEDLADLDYYLSEDGTILRIDYNGMIYDFTADTETGGEIFAFLKQIPLDPDTVYATLTAPAEPVSSGDTVVVTFDLTQNPGIAGISLALSYDDTVLTLTNVQGAGMMAAGNLTLGGNLAANPFNIIWDDATSHENHTETGTILTLTFTVKEGIPSGTTTISMQYDANSTFDVDLQNVPVVLTDAKLSVIGHLPGDVDADGDVDLADTTILMRYLVGGWNVTINERNSDVNGDGELDLKDVVLIRRAIVGGWGVVLV